MSGPKLMHVTTDPIERLINARIMMTIGKVAYFSPLIDGVNSDVQNEIGWFERYDEQIRSSITQMGTPKQKETRDALRKLQIIKTRYAAELRREIIDKEIVEHAETAEINTRLVRVVELLPRIKERFIKEISETMQYLDEIIKHSEEEAYERQKEVEKRIAEKKAQRKALERKTYEKNASDYEMESEQYRESLAERIELEETEEWEVFDRTSTLHEKAKPRQTCFTISEQAKIDMIKSDMESILQELGFDEREKELLQNLKADLENLSDNNEFFSQNGKKAILNRLEMNYNSLNCMIAARRVARTERRTERGSLEAEYLTYARMLELTSEEPCSMEIEELAERVKELREAAMERMLREYMEETITEVMRTKGYTSVCTTTVDEQKKLGSLIFENEENVNIRASLNDDMIMIEVVGDGEHPPTPEETEKLVRNQGELCRIYPEIKTELEQKGIHIESEICTPVSADTAKNIPISANRDKKRKRYSFGRIWDLVPSGNEDVRRYMENVGKNAGYMEREL